MDTGVRLMMRLESTSERKGRSERLPTCPVLAPSAPLENVGNGFTNRDRPVHGLHREVGNRRVEADLPENG